MMGDDDDNEIITLVRKWTTYIINIVIFIITTLHVKLVQICVFSKNAAG